MEIIDFNPYIVRRRLHVRAETGAKTGIETRFSPVLGQGEAVAEDNKALPGPTEDPGDGKVVLWGKLDATSDPKLGEQGGRSGVVTRMPLQIPVWIPTKTALRCSLPYTSYEIPIPSDLNMDFCIDVMMGQDTIVFMFVRGVYCVSMSPEADLCGFAG